MKTTIFSNIFLVLLCACICAGTAAAAELDATLATFDHDPHPDLRSVLVLRHGRIVAERYYNGETADTLHDVRSAGKSITGLLVGTAVDRALLATNARIGTIWPAAHNSALADVTLDNVLTMRSGLASFDADPDSPGNEDKMDEAPDTLKFILAIPRATPPGTQYRYNSLTAHVAALAVEQASGRDLEAYARTALFAPLGITRWHWDRDASGHPKGQGNLSLRTRDLGTIGQLVLDQGLHEGRRVLSAAWIATMLAPHVDISANDRYADSYGYLWYGKTHQVDGKPVQVHFASGNGGNKIYVVPALDEVVVVTSSAYGKGYGQLRSENILKAVLGEQAAR